ncbi:MAG: hypothetical protein EH225_10270, partial [Calditrichaeota bacterium]
MSNIRDKLSRLDRTSYDREDAERSEHPVQETWMSDFEKEIGARIIREKNSFIILKENIFPFHQHPLHAFFLSNNG